jgi:hypothetical protein
MSHRAIDRGDVATLSIVEQIADAQGVAADELPPLYRAIDPDIITSLPAAAKLSFPYHGYTVCVQGDGTVWVRETGDAESSSDA